MKQVEMIASGKNFASINVGKLNELNQHVLELGPDMKIPGKVFVGGALKTTGAEMSLNRIEAGSGVAFLHTHKTHEELYIIVSGEGQFQVDGEIFPIIEGSVVRVSPNGRRSIRNTGKEPMIMICVQYKSGTFSAQDAQDADILGDEVKW
ncbi:MAG: cupin domain-containing protein [Prevotella sp.]|jgi:mannose-6-phosphate isomerase-like protein (cupin superfamily)|nr:cupin domain-containing protein [Prevotella sp.]